MEQTVKVNKNIAQKRDSNIEFLRIILMILITMSHYSLYTNLTSISKSTSIIVVWGGKVGVELFLIISGYYLTNSNFKIKKLIKLWLEVFLYSATIFLILVLTKKVDVKSIYDSILYILPISGSKYGFATTYIHVYLLSPFIIKALKSIDKKTFRNMLIVIITFYLLCKDILLSSNIEYFESTFGYIFFFSVGIYIRIYKINFLEKSQKRNIFMLFGIMIIYFIKCFVIAKLGELNTIQSIICKFINNLLSFSVNSTLTLVVSVLMFYIFRSIPIRYNKVINYFASTSFAVFLFQEHPLLRKIIWEKIFNTKLILVKNLESLKYANTSILNKIVAIPTVYLAQITNIETKNFLIFHCFFSVILIYLIATVIETIRVFFIEKPIFYIINKSKTLNKIFYKIDTWMNL